MKFFETVLEETSSGIMVVGKRNELLFANHQAQALWNISDSLLMEKNASRILEHIMEQTNETKQCQNMMECLHGTVNSTREYLYCKSGNVIEYQTRPHIEDGENAGYVWLFNDVTCLVASQEKYQQQKQLFETLMNTVPVPIYHKSREGKYLGCNQSMLDGFGYEEKNVIGKTPYDIASNEVAKHYERKDEELYANPDEVQVYEYVLKNVNTRETREVVFYKRAYRDNQGEPAGLIGAVLDITERNKMEEAILKNSYELAQRVEHEVNQRMALEREQQEQQTLLVQKSKMASLGEMISAISHQWKQPVYVLSLVTEELKSALSQQSIDTELLKRTVVKMEDMTDFMKKTLEEFRSFYKPDKEKVAFSPCEQLCSIYLMFKSELLSANIDLRIHECSDINAYGYPNEFKQVLLNIVENARDAIIGNLETEGRTDFHSGVEEGASVIRIRDNGGGISEDLLPDKLFENHISSKGNNGSGMGLYISRIIIEKSMGGKLWAQNVDDGAEFVIELPLA